MDLTGRVAKIIDDYTAVINIGELDGVYEGQRFIVYELGDMIVDPVTQKELEQIELSKIRVKVIHVQEKVSLVEGYITKPVEHTAETKLIFIPTYRWIEEKYKITEDTNGVKIGDYVRPIDEI